MNEKRPERELFDDGDHLSREELFLYQDDRLGPSAKERCERHLRDCSLCTGEYARLAELESGLRGRPIPAPSKAFVDRVVSASLEQASENERGTDARGRLAAAARRYTAGRAGSIGLGFVVACLVLVALAATMVVGIIDVGSEEGVGASHSASNAVSGIFRPVGDAMVHSLTELTTTLTGPVAAVVAFLSLYALDLFIRRRRQDSSGR